MTDRLRVAAIVTIYHPKSHADVIVTKFLKGMSTDEGLLAPEIEIVSMYLDHALENDIGQRLAAEHDVPIYPSIRRALHAGGNELGVDAVLLIGEHGDYPWNEAGRHCYPRRYFFEQIAGVFGESGRSVPVFNDKHLAYDFVDARWMWDRARELDIPLMAGSSVPLAWRNPTIEYPLDTPIQQALGVGYGGIEAYGFHALEALQCMIERRPGGESGVVSVQCLEGDEMWQSRDRGQWSGELAAAACAPIEGKPEGAMADHVRDPAVFLVEHADGLRTATVMLSGYVNQFAYAGQVRGGPCAGVHGIEFHLQEGGPFSHFSYLCRNIQKFFRTGVAPSPTERTLLTTGIIDAAMISRHEDHRLVETPYLDIAYESYRELPARPGGSRPSGACIDPKAPDIV